MTEENFLARQFEANRDRLRAVAYRMLGSATEAEDAVQEAWLRLARSDTAAVDNLGGWLTTVVARICLDMLRAHKSRREDALGDETPVPTVSADEIERDALLADSIGAAMLAVLQKLTPAERVAFVLHDMFDLSFEEIARVIDRSQAAARQLASRARRRVQGPPVTLEPDRARQREIVAAFLAASRDGDFEMLLNMLDPDVVYRTDRMAQQMGGPPELRGAAAVAAAFKGRAKAAKPALVDGALGAAVILGGELRIVLALSFADGRISKIDVVADSARLGGFNVVPLD